MESNVCVCLCLQDWASTWSNSFFCLNRSPSASAMIRKSFLSSPSCFSMNCLVSRACCLSFCSSAWQRVKDTDKFHSITAKTRTTGPRFRCTLVLLLFFTEASFNMACSLSQEKQAKHTHRPWRNVRYNDRVYSELCPWGISIIFCVCLTGATLVFSSIFSLPS